MDKFEAVRAAFDNLNLQTPYVVQSGFIYYRDNIIIIPTPISNPVALQTLATLFNLVWRQGARDMLMSCVDQLDR